MGYGDHTRSPLWQIVLTNLDYFISETATKFIEFPMVQFISKTLHARVENENTRLRHCLPITSQDLVLLKSEDVEVSFDLYH